MRSRAIAALTLLAACHATEDRPPASAGWTARDSARVDAVLAPLVASHAFMGAVAFARGDSVVYATGRGMANIAAGKPFTPGTPSDGGSLAKTFTAAAVWSLVHEGRLAIDTPVTAYLPDYPHAGTTVRHLIAHSNGLLPYYEQFDPYFAPTEVRTTTALLDVVRRHMPRPRFTPGSRFEYSNLGFDVAALVVERVTGQPIATVFRDRFFAPLRLDSTFARPGRLADFPQPRTMGYRWADTGWVTWEIYDNDAVIGGSNLHLSAIDLARWGGAQATGRALPAGVMTMGQEPPTIEGRPSPITGLSWYCDDAQVRCHYGGAYNAFHSIVWWDRGRRAAVSMVSNSNLDAWTMMTLQRDLVAILEGREPERSARPAFTAVPDSARAAIAGRWVAAGGRQIHVRTAPELTVQVDNGLVLALFQVAPDQFYLPGLDWVLGVSGPAGDRRLHVRSMFLDETARPAR